MSDLCTHKSELFETALVVLGRAKIVNVSEICSAQDAMLNMRIDWEELQSRLRNRQIDGFEPAVDAMLQLAATTLAMAAALQAKIINQRIVQLRREEDAKLDVVEEMKTVAKQRKRATAK